MVGLADRRSQCRINTFLDNVDVGEYYVHGDLEAYSCKATVAATVNWHDHLCL